MIIPNIHSFKFKDKIIKPIISVDINVLLTIFLKHLMVMVIMIYNVYNAMEIVKDVQGLKKKSVVNVMNLLKNKSIIIPLIKFYNI